MGKTLRPQTNWTRQSYEKVLAKVDAAIEAAA
jgi:hypothetical protein